MKNLIIGLLLAGGSMNLFAQSKLGAFEKSYELEQAQNFKGAIQSLIYVYDENSYELNLRLGWLQYQASDFQKSMTYYQRAIKLNDKSIEARVGLTYPLSALGKNDDLIDVYNEILEIDANNSTANYWLGYIYYLKKDNKKALEHVSKVIELYPFDYDSNFLIGRIYIAQGKIDEAKAALTLAQLYSPGSTYVSDLLKKL